MRQSFVRPVRSVACMCGALSSYPVLSPGLAAGAIARLGAGDQVSTSSCAPSCGVAPDRTPAPFGIRVSWLWLRLWSSSTVPGWVPLDTAAARPPNSDNRGWASALLVQRQRTSRLASNARECGCGVNQRLNRRHAMPGAPWLAAPYWPVALSGMWPPTAQTHGRAPRRPGSGSRGRLAAGFRSSGNPRSHFCLPPRPTAPTTPQRLAAGAIATPRPGCRLPGGVHPGTLKRSKPLRRLPPGVDACHTERFSCSSGAQAGTRGCRHGRPRGQPARGMARHGPALVAAGAGAGEQGHALQFVFRRGLGGRLVSAASDRAQ